jgi:hypothetical protein
MKAQEVEQWAREIVSAVVSNRRVEDSRVELKSVWPDAYRAAGRLAGHANSARGMPILWLIGVDEKNHTLTNVDPVELASWYDSVQKSFDGFAPRLLIDVNVRFDSDVVVALYFETEREAPYVVKNSTGGYPDFIVPWREGTRLRAARRDELLRIFVPIRRFSSLIDELEFNRQVAHAIAVDNEAWGTPFREAEFHKALADAAISTLPDDLRNALTHAYVVMGRANLLVTGAVTSLLLPNARAQQISAARRAVKESQPSIEGALAALKSTGSH